MTGGLRAIGRALLTELKGIFRRPLFEADWERDRRAGWSRERTAEERWREHNRRARECGCPCGKPATEVRYHHGTAGSVPAETWTCVDHVGVTVWIQEVGVKTPYWPRTSPCGDCAPMKCGGSTSRIDQPPHQWHCPAWLGSAPAGRHEEAGTVGAGVGHGPQGAAGEPRLTEVPPGADLGSTHDPGPFAGHPGSGECFEDWRGLHDR